MAKLTRRQFFATSAAAAAPLILPQGVLGQGGNPGANDRITLGFIGVGGMGRGLMQHMMTLQPVAALCDVDRQHLEGAASWVDTPVDLYGDYRRILDRSDIDAVVIATPDHWHAVQTVHALEAGKDVYVEKPLCNTVAEGKAVIDAVKRYGRILQVGSQGRSMPIFHKICTYIRNGELGAVDRVDCYHYENRTGESPPNEEPPDHLDWDMWLGPARWVPYNPARCPFTFRWFMEYGGGNVRDRGAHVLSLVMWFLDRDGDLPVRVTATGTPPETGLYNCPTAMEVAWEFENPDLTVTWTQPGEREGFGAVYHGERDSLLVTGGDGGGGTTSEEVEAYEPPADGVEVFESPGHHQNWFDCIKTREQPIMDVEAGHNVATICNLANWAYLLGRPLEFDPETQQVVGDEQANRLLNMPGRGPWHV